jgi:uncharacterized protein (DUF3820 family)
MSVTNPEFSGLGQPISYGVKTLGLMDQMPIGKHKGDLIVSLIEVETGYIRWFVDNVDRYKLSEEALLELDEVENDIDSPAPPAVDNCWNNSDVRRWDDDDIPF